LVPEGGSWTRCDGDEAVRLLGARPEPEHLHEVPDAAETARHATVLHGGPPQAETVDQAEREERIRLDAIAWARMVDYRRDQAMGFTRGSAEYEAAVKAQAEAEARAQGRHPDQQAQAQAQ